MDSNEKLFISADSSIIVGFEPQPFSIQFIDQDNEIGKLYQTESGGKLKFEGNIGASAKIFFNEVIKCQLEYNEGKK